MNLALIVVVFGVAFVAATPIKQGTAVSVEKVIGYAEQYVECLGACKGHKEAYQGQEQDCKLSCKDKFSAEYGSYGFYPEKVSECKDMCNVQYGILSGTKKSYPEKNKECTQRCGELYGYRKLSR